MKQVDTDALVEAMAKTLLYSKTGYKDEDSRDFMSYGMSFMVEGVFYRLGFIEGENLVFDKMRELEGDDAK